MKQITINIPDNCELKQDGNTYTIVEKEKKLTYTNVAEKLFKYNSYYYTAVDGNIRYADYSNNGHISTNDPNNCTSKKQAEKLFAINKLMNVAKYLNNGWQPDWSNDEQMKYFIVDENEKFDLTIRMASKYQSAIVYFKNKELTAKAIEILGEETIKLALSSDY